MVPDRPNVVLVVVDTLRADHPGAYGGPARTPALDSLAARGVLFERAYSHAPSTVPSHASLFTSLLPAQHGARTNRHRLPPGATTVAEVLRDAGWHTAAFVSLGVLRSASGLSRGFVEYDDRFGDGGWWHPADLVNARVLPWIRANETRPFFLWVHYSDPHEPYLAPRESYPRLRLRLEGAPPGPEHEARGDRVELRVRVEPGTRTLEILRTGGPRESIELRGLRVEGLDPPAFGEGWDPDTHRYVRDLRTFRYVSAGADRAELLLTNPTDAPRDAVLSFRPWPAGTTVEDGRARYREEVEHADRHLGDLLDALAELDEPTLVVFTSDHGEQLGERGRFGHVDTLFEADLRVPLVLAGPGIPTGHRIRARARHVDVLPTLRTLLDLPEGTGTTGRALWPLHELRDAPHHAQTFRPEAKTDVKATRVDRWSLIHDETTGEIRLHDLGTDPGELRNLVEQARDRLRELEPIHARFADLPPRFPGEAIPSSAEEREMLRALGYGR